MKVGYVGAGKIGLPMAVVLDSVGHDVMVADVSDEPARYLAERRVPYREEGLDELLQEHTVRAGTIAEVVEHADVVFVTVQTPHQPAYDGTQPAPATRRDFEYGYLVAAVRAIAAAADERRKPITVVIVSTVLPGTFNRHLRRFESTNVHLVYSPCFIAMGTTVADFANPEFVLVGAEPGQTWEVGQLRDVYGKLHDRPIRVVSIESAELTKVAYNVYLSAKIAFANYIGEIAHKTGADADEVTDSLALATDRILSPRYMRAGMGDGGGCHPRDLIALSHLAEQLDLSYDLADALMSAREAHSGWLADIVTGWHELTRLDVVVLGRSYKPETDLVLGSPAALLVDQLVDAVGGLCQWDPHVDDGIELELDEPAVFVVATRHHAFTELDIPAGSIVIDPFGFMPHRDGVTNVAVGRQ